MTKEQQSGAINQRGMTDHCGAPDDTLPLHIYGDKSHTRGGGELHVDQAGLFLKKFRNVLFKSSEETQSPEYDRVEIEVVEDSYMHLTFAIPAKGTLDLNVVLQDTMMMNQELKPRNAFMINDIEDESRELVFSYKL